MTDYTPRAFQRILHRRDGQEWSVYTLGVFPACLGDDEWQEVCMVHEAGRTLCGCRLENWPGPYAVCELAADAPVAGPADLPLAGGTVLDALRAAQKRYQEPEWSELVNAIGVEQQRADDLADADLAETWPEIPASERIGHTPSCARRIAMGDGVCECGLLTQ